MEGLQKKITGDWFDIKENGDTPNMLEEYFKPSTADLKKLAGELRLSVEEGIVEYKKSVLNPIFPFLESLKYDSRGLEELAEQAKTLSPAIYATLIQRSIAVGKTPLSKREAQKAEEIESDLKTIVQNMNNKIAENPGLKTNDTVKHILFQVQRYKKELEKMKSLLPNIPEEKKQDFMANFKKEFQEITASIFENYTKLQKEEEKSLQDKMSQNPLTQFNLVPLGKLFFSQAQDMSRIRATIEYAKKEGFRTREFLVKLGNDRDTIMAAYKKEMDSYYSMTGSREKAAATAKRFGAEVIRVLERQIRRREVSSGE